jgi:hypothetical protein
MTAIAAVYTRCGFVIAADGKLDCEDADASDAARQAARDDAQKIFDFSGDGCSMACAFMGIVLNASVGYDLVKECKRQVSSLLCGPFRFQCGVTFVYELSDRLKGYIDGFRGLYRGSVGHKPIIMLVVGYLKGVACWFKVGFLECWQSPAICPKDLSHYVAWDALGADKVKKAMYEDHDPRFAAYTKLPTGGMSLRDGEEFAKGYIEACKTQLARELDPFCKHIGGHVHVAQVTPLRFTWVIPPESTPENAGGAT